VGWQYIMTKKSRKQRWQCDAVGEARSAADKGKTTLP